MTIFTESQHASLRAAWAQSTIDDILNLKKEQQDASADGTPHHRVITIDATTSAEEAFDTLVKHNINAAPVWDPASKSYIGMVSMLDVVEFVLMLVHANKAVWQEMDAELESASSSGSLNTSRHNTPITSARESSRDGLVITEIASRIRQVKDVPVSLISDLAKRDPFMSLPRTATLDQAMDIFSKGIHRIVVTDDGGSELIGILTQSDLIRFVSESKKSETDEILAKVLQMRLNELKLSDAKEIILVKSHQPVIDALKAMHTHTVSSVAVVDPGDRLLGNISASDVKHMMRHLRYGIMFQTCSQFIGNVKTRAMLDNMGKDIVPVIQVSPTAVLGQVLRLLVVTKVHRVWCTEQNSHASKFQAPISVISLTDIIRVLM